MRIAAKNDPLLAAAMPVIFALEAELAASKAMRRALEKKKRLLEKKKKRLMDTGAEQSVAHDLD